MKIGQNLKRIRKELRLTQAELAKTLGLSQAAIAEYETDTRMPSLKVANKLIKLAKSKKIKVKIDDFFPEEE